jgi:hypothetical protein
MGSTNCKVPETIYCRNRKRGQTQKCMLNYKIREARSRGLTVLQFAFGLLIGTMLAATFSISAFDPRRYGETLGVVVD